MLLWILLQSFWQIFVMHSSLSVAREAQVLFAGKLLPLICEVYIWVNYKVLFVFHYADPVF